MGTEAADMQAAAAAVLLLAGLVSADGGDQGDHAAQHGTVLAEPLAAQPDTSNYYSQQAYTDTFAPAGGDGFYDPYASNFLTQEQDRTDTGLLGGLTIGVLITVFLAALLGSIVAPALTAAVTRGTELVSKVQLPEITLKDVESEDMEEDDTARAFQAGLSFVQNLVSPRVKRS